jgi:hypothetical protein
MLLNCTESHVHETEWHFSPERETAEDVGEIFAGVLAIDSDLHYAGFIWGAYVISFESLQDCSEISWERKCRKVVVYLEKSTQERDHFLNLSGDSTTKYFKQKAAIEAAQESANREVKFAYDNAPDSIHNRHMVQEDWLTCSIIASPALHKSTTLAPGTHCNYNTQLINH